MKKEDYPILYKMASDASANNQKAYFGLLGAYLLVLCVSGVIDNFVENQWFSFIAFLLSWTLFALLQHYKFQEKWYNCRATAESVKCITWCWMMGAEPYSRGNADKKLKAEIFKMYEGVKSLIHLPENCNDGDCFVSTKMREVRGSNLDEKKDFYKNHRYEDQKKWYASKGKFNGEKHKYGFLAFNVLYIIVSVLFLYNIFQDENISTTYILTMASALVAWMEAKRYSDLKNAYTVSSCDIQMMGAADNIIDEKEFAKYVRNCENAFSREHVRWAARAS